MFPFTEITRETKNDISVSITNMLADQAEKALTRLITFSIILALVTVICTVLGMIYRPNIMYMFYRPMTRPSAGQICHLLCFPLIYKVKK